MKFGTRFFFADCSASQWDREKARKNSEHGVFVGKKVKHLVIDEQNDIGWVDRKHENFKKHHGR